MTYEIFVFAVMRVVDWTFCDKDFSDEHGFCAMAFRFNDDSELCLDRATVAID